MDNRLQQYLETVERCLKPLPIAERLDIVQEIKSEMLELEGEGRAPEEILARLGDPKALARAYLGGLVVQGAPWRWTRVLALCAYYSLAGLSGMIVIPVLVVCAPVFWLCGIVTPVLGAVKLADAVLKLRLPYVQYIVVAGVDSPVLAFALCVLAGLVLCLLGWGCWKLLTQYIRGMGLVKDRLLR